MKIKEIHLDDSEGLSEVTVKMTIQEACWIANIAGVTNNMNSELHSEIYDCLVGGLFNKFYDDGIREAHSDLGVVMPKHEDVKLDKGVVDG